jgi:hypothetical protein
MTRFISLKTQSQLLVLLAILLSLQSFWISAQISTSPDLPFPDEHQQRNPTVHGVVGSSPNPLENGSILPDGTVTFTPDEFHAGHLDKYVNLPNNPVDPMTDIHVQHLMRQPVPEATETLMQKAPDPPGVNAIVGLASYPKFMDGWRKLVGSLRINGYDGHIIVGVNKDIPTDEREYLDRMGVTYYAVETANCSSAILNQEEDTSNKVRSVCSRGLDELKLEWGRYEMARRWLKACTTCTGWAMVIDTRDIFFQRDPFASLGRAENATHNLLFVEEIASYTNTLPKAPHRAVNIGQSMRYKHHVEPCYGKANVKAYELIHRPMLCSGTVIGTTDGIHRFLSVLVDEFRKNNAKGPMCRSPVATDQWTMNYLYYKGKFGFVQQTKTMPWGTGPVLTVGKPCVNSELKDGNSQIDMMQFGSDGLVLNPHEPDESLARVAPALHQWDRCRGWIKPWFDKHEDLFMRTKKPSEEPFMPWVQSSSSSNSVHYRGN